MLAYETDLLEYPDLFEGSVVMEGLVDELLAGAREELARVAEQGGAVEAVPYMKAALVESHRARIARIEAGEQVLVGVNRFTESEPSPLRGTAGSSSSTRRWRRSSARRSTRGAPAATRRRCARRWPCSRAWPRPRTRT